MPSFPRSPIIAALVLLGVLLASCGGSDANPDDNRFISSNSDAPFLPVLVSSNTSTNADRLVLTLLEGNRAPNFPLDTTFTVRYLDAIENGFRFRDQAAATMIETADGVFYTAPVSFDRTGFWAIEVVATLPDGETISSARLPIEINTRDATPIPGDAAPASPTLTLRDGPLTQISSAFNPTPALYETALNEALDAGQPFVVVFSTVGYCFGSTLCQRAVDQVARLSAQTGVLGIHSEPLTVDDGVTPIPSEAGVLSDWSLQNDPWIFVVDATGTISASFELVVSDDELLAALQAVVPR
jgi:hypothetical protein